MLALPQSMIIKGDFKCVLRHTDCTKEINFTQQLDVVARNLGWVDVSKGVTPRVVRTDCTSDSAARIDHA